MSGQASFSKCFVYKLKRMRKAGVFQCLWFEERFRKAPFSWRISVDGTPYRRNKAAFSWRISVDGRPNRRNKAPFSWRICVEGRPNRRNKAAFSISSGLKSFVFVSLYWSARGSQRVPPYLLTRWTIYGEVNEPIRPADVEEPIPIFLKTKNCKIETSVRWHFGFSITLNIVASQNNPSLGIISCLESFSQQEVERHRNPSVPFYKFF